MSPTPGSGSHGLLFPILVIYNFNLDIGKKAATKRVHKKGGKKAGSKKIRKVHKKVIAPAQIEHHEEVHH